MTPGASMGLPDLGVPWARPPSSSARSSASRLLLLLESDTFQGKALNVIHMASMGR